jgi:hypothetical protein
MSLPTQEPELRPDPTGVSYSNHDPQESGAAGFGRDDGDDDSLGVEFVSNVLYVLRGLEAPVVLFASIIYNVWLPYRHGLLFRVPPSAAVVVALDAGRVTEFVPEAEHPVEIP